MFADGDTQRSVLVDPEQQQRRPVSDSEEVISSHVSQYSSLTSASHGTRVYQLSTAATGFTEIHQLFTYPNSTSTNTTTSTTKH